MVLLLRVLLSACAVAASDLNVGFCDSNGRGFSKEQPPDHMERWDLPYDNGTHLVIDWRNDRRVSGMNVSSYEVTVHTSLPILNWFVGIFGSFPQDVSTCTILPALCDISSPLLSPTDVNTSIDLSLCDHPCACLAVVRTGR